MREISGPVAGPVTVAIAATMGEGYRLGRSVGAGGGELLLLEIDELRRNDRDPATGAGAQGRGALPALERRALAHDRARPEPATSSPSTITASTPSSGR